MPRTPYYAAMARGTVMVCMSCMPYYAAVASDNEMRVMYVIHTMYNAHAAYGSN